jgi:hypothetical protein
MVKRATGAVSISLEALMVVLPSEGRGWRKERTEQSVSQDRWWHKQDARYRGLSMFHVTVFDGKDMFEYDTALACLQPGIHVTESRPDFVVVIREIKKEEEIEGTGGLHQPAGESRTGLLV